MSYAKTVWSETVGITPARLNNLETQYEKSIADSVPQNYDGRPEDVTITAGAGQQFSTIQAAIDSLKKVNAGRRIINAATGHTEPGDITIAGFHGGNIVIANAFAQDVNINGTVNVNENTARITLSYLNITGTNGFFNCQNNMRVTLNRCKNNVANSNGIWAYSGGSYYLTSCQFSNHTNIAIDAILGSTVTLETVTGTGNLVGINSSGAIIMKNIGSTITGTTQTQKSSGGQIF